MAVSPDSEIDWKRKLKELGLARPRRARGSAPAVAAIPPRREKILHGRTGEEIAAAHLVARRLTIVAKNVRYRDGELDLVAKERGKGGTLVFVEVKRRRTTGRGDPAEAVTPLKRSRILRAAKRWLARNPAHADGGTCEVRFDVVAILDDPPSIEWIQGAFDASE